MRLTDSKYLCLSLILLAAAFSGCNRPPDLPDAPNISFEHVEFEVLNEGDPLFESNLLRLSFNVSDGDGDLGLDGNDNTPPYHSFDLRIGSDGAPVEFGDRPEDPPFTCLDYAIEDRENTDLNRDGDLLDTLLIDFNEDQYNIFVDFFVKKDGTFEELEIRAQPSGSANEITLCGISFDGRFPCLSSEDDPCNFISTNDRPIEGVVTYEMNSGLFLPVFRTDTIKLVFQIQDRALNRSNSVETPEFTLQSIRVEN